MLSKWCTGFLAYIVSKVELSSSIEEMLVIWEFPDVFLIELSGVALEQKIKFNIKLTLSITFISKALCRMTLAELQKLKRQLQELLENGFSRPSHSP